MTSQLAKTAMNEKELPIRDPSYLPALGDLSRDDTFARLAARLVGLGEVAVAFSGGADSSFLAYVARATLGRENVTAITAVSPSFGSAELEHCRELAERWDIPFRTIDTEELENPRYVANGPDRCYWCKAELMHSIRPLIDEAKTSVVLGVNLDDLGEHRPGQDAAREAGAIFPLADAGYSKGVIREHSRILGLSTWDRPQSACLSSRIPYGTAVTVPVLSRLDRAEAALKALGFSQVRVRHYDDLARIEFLVEDLQAALNQRLRIVEAVKATGYDYVTIDLEGFRSGNLNSKIGKEVGHQRLE